MTRWWKPATNKTSWSINRNGLEVQGLLEWRQIHVRSSWVCLRVVRKKHQGMNVKTKQLCMDITHEIQDQSLMKSQINRKILMPCFAKRVNQIVVEFRESRQRWDSEFEPISSRQRWRNALHVNNRPSAWKRRLWFKAKQMHNANSCQRQIHVPYRVFPGCVTGKNECHQFQQHKIYSPGDSLWHRNSIQLLM